MDPILILTSISVNGKHGVLFQNLHDCEELLLPTFSYIFFQDCDWFLFFPLNCGLASAD